MSFVQSVYAVTISGHSAGGITDDANISGLLNAVPGSKFTTTTNLAQLITGGGFNLLDLVFAIVGLAFFFNLVLAGWDYMMSTGDPKKVTAASSRFTNGLIGLVMAITAFLVVRTIGQVIGIPGII